MNRIVISNSHNPYFNLALEETLFYGVQENETILYLWQNDQTVVMGRNQNPWLECDIEALEKNKIKLARRLSGGGTVYHDLGNLNFTFITKQENQDLPKQLKVILEALVTLGVQASQSGRNDLLVNGKKFSGHAFYEEDGCYFHHGTLMVAVDIEMLEQVLKPSKLKLKSKGIESIKSRVVNLKDIEKSIETTTLKKALIEQFEKLYGKSIITLKDESCELHNFERYQSKNWIMGECPSFNVTIEKRVEDLGNFTATLQVTDNTIKDVHLYSDTLKKIDFKAVEEMLVGKEFSKQDVENILETL